MQIKKYASTLHIQTRAQNRGGGAGVGTQTARGGIPARPKSLQSRGSWGQIGRGGEVSWVPPDSTSGEWVGASPSHSRHPRQPGPEGLRLRSPRSVLTPPALPTRSVADSGSSRTAGTHLSPGAPALPRPPSQEARAPEPSLPTPAHHPPAIRQPFQISAGGLRAQ